MSPAKRAVWREGTAEDPELVPMRVKIWISSQWPKINRQKSCNHNHRPCRWFAQAPLGHVPGRAYRLIERSANRADFPGLPLKGPIYLPSFTGLPVNGSMYSEILIWSDVISS